MKNSFLKRPAAVGVQAVVATNQGWLGLRDNDRHPTELLISHKGLYDKLEELDQLLEIDIEYNSGKLEVSGEGKIVITPTELSTVEATPESEVEPELEELAPLEELTEYTEEILSKYPKKELMDFVKANDLGKPTSGKAAIEILLSLQG